jgi:hypothetical protein
LPDAGQSRRHFPPKTARSAVEEMEMERQVPTRRQPQATEIDTADVAYREHLRRSIRGAIVIKWDDRRAFDIK